MRVRPTLTVLILAALLAVVAPSAAVAGDGGRPLGADLTGAAEVPGPGDPDGAGSASLRLNPGQGRICYELGVTGIEPATAAHIHVGAPGEAGPVVVPLAAPTSGESSGCAAVVRAVVLAIIHDPANYYVNVHNAVYPAGAVRGQLG